MPSSKPVFLAALACALVVVSPAAANVPNSRLLSHTPSGDPANAPATEATISGDGRQARYAAFTSRATDIAGGGKQRKVFLVKRKRPFGFSGSRWREDRIVSVTKGANGDSWSPTFDGFQDTRTRAPRCLAFVSEASNLVTKDGNGKTADVFIRSMSSGRLRRVPGTGGASEVILDGHCRYLAFVKHGRPYVATLGGRTRAAGGSGAHDLDLSGINEVLVYERAGAVWVSKPGRGARRLASGHHPTTDALGRYVAFDRGGKIRKGQLAGPLQEHGIPQRGGQKRGSAMPNLSAGGTFVSLVVRSLVYISGYSIPKGDCTRGRGAYRIPAMAVGPEMSARGNYIVYSCEGGPAWLTYVGGQATGNPE